MAEIWSIRTQLQVNYFYFFTMEESLVTVDQGDKQKE